MPSVAFVCTADILHGTVLVSNGALWPRAPTVRDAFMSEQYNPDSCNTLEKAFYRPIEAALRWCNLINQEEIVLSVMGDEVVPKLSDFPQWPCLRTNAEKIFEAMEHGELPYGRDGRSVPPGETVAKHRMTVRHADLKAWMIADHPGQKPAFLFDETERKTHSAINADSFRRLQADLQALQSELEEKEHNNQSLTAKNTELLERVRELESQLDQSGVGSGQLNERSERTYRNIVAALLDCVSGKAPGKGPHPDFESEKKLIEFIAEKYAGIPGLSESNLSRKFPEAKRSLEST